MRLKRLLLCGLFLAPLFLSGCVLDTMMTDFVNAGPKAVIDATPDDGVAPLTVTFDAHYSRDADGSIVEYRWEFGDPANREVEKASECAHTYVSPGTYIATLTVVDNEGMTDSQQIAIVVDNAPPVGDFTISNANPLPGVEVIFNAGGSYDPDGEIVSYHWDFGDGITSGGVTAQHTYTNGGHYVVRLTLTDDQGQSAVVTHPVQVTPGQSKCADDSTCGGGAPKPIAVVNTFPAIACKGRVEATVGQTIKFDGLYSKVEEPSQIVSYTWDLGDGTILSGGEVTHAYMSAGSYYAEFTVVSSDGLSDSCRIRVEISTSGGSTCP